LAIFTTEIAEITEAKPEKNCSVFSVSSAVKFYPARTARYRPPTIPGKARRIEDIQTRPDFPRKREAKRTMNMATQSQANQSPACA